jgi:hypothetical protein
MIVLHWAQRLGVELLLANLQLATDAVAADVKQLQRLGREFTLGDLSEFESDTHYGRSINRLCVKRW